MYIGSHIHKMGHRCCGSGREQCVSCLCNVCCMYVCCFLYLCWDVLENEMLRLEAVTGS